MSTTDQELIELAEALESERRHSTHYTTRAAAALRKLAVSPTWTQADADEWGKRHDINSVGRDLFDAFEDAATMYLERRP